MNFKSIQEAQTLSIVANKNSLMQDNNCFESGLQAIPKLLRSAVIYGANASSKKNLAQLIFSTRQTSLLDTKFVRRDQIWFMEKNDKDASVLYPLTDFSPRASENIEKGYLEGRFGAIPFIGALKY